MNQNSLIIAISKGRIMDDTLPILNAVGIVPEDDLKKTRKLIVNTNISSVRLVVIRASDVPTYVSLGAADLGVAGKDVLMEQEDNNLIELLDLKIARCRLMTAAKVDHIPRHGRIRVATKFSNIAKKYYASRGIQADIIKLYGSMELAPLVDLADEIVDLVDTGNTLKANGLMPLNEIATISTRLVVNKAAFKTKHRLIKPLIEKMAQLVSERSGKDA